MYRNIAKNQGRSRSNSLASNNSFDHNFNPQKWSKNKKDDVKDDNFENAQEEGEG